MYSMYSMYVASRHVNYSIQVVKTHLMRGDESPAANLHFMQRNTRARRADVQETLVQARARNTRAKNHSCKLLQETLVQALAKLLQAGMQACKRGVQGYCIYCSY